MAGVFIDHIQFGTKAFMLLSASFIAKPYWLEHLADFKRFTVDVCLYLVELLNTLQFSAFFTVSLTFVRTRGLEGRKASKTRQMSSCCSGQRRGQISFQMV